MYNLDLDHDGITDFVFTERAFPVSIVMLCRNHLPGTEYSAKINSPGGTGNAFKSRIDCPYPFDSLTVIDSNATWVKNDSTTDNHNLYS